VDIKRSELTKRRFRRNLFSCLFQKQWDGFHVRDKNGRIYMDLKEEWLRPFIDFMKYDTNPFYGSVLDFSLILFTILRYFNMGKRIYLNPNIVIKGLENSRVQAIRSGEKDHWNKIVSACFPTMKDKFWDKIVTSLSTHKPLPMDFTLVYSQNSEKHKKEFHHDFDVKFRQLLCVIEMKSGETYVKYIDETFTYSFSELFPLQFYTDDSVLALEIPYKITSSSSSYKFLEIYQVGLNYEKLQIKCASISNWENNSDFSDSSSRNFDDIGDGNAAILCNMMKAYKRKLDDRRKNQLQNQMQKLHQEIQFMTSYFQNCWSIDQMCDGDSDVDNCFEILRTIIKRKKSLSESSSEESEETTVNILVPDEGTDRNTLDPIVYFNVEGEVISILRSTILKVIPDRVWEEIEKDLDEEGNVIINCHKESFKQIVASLQFSLYSSKLKIFVNVLCRRFIEKSLAFLKIIPDGFLFLD
jgi:hypothetical protein